MTDLNDAPYSGGAVGFLVGYLYRLFFGGFDGRLVALIRCTLLT